MAIEIKHRNPIQIGTCSNEYENIAIKAMKYRELLYNRDDKSLGIIIDDSEGNKYRQIIGGDVDEYNVTRNNENQLTLTNDITTQTYTATSDGTGSTWSVQKLLGTTSAASTIILLFKRNDDPTNGQAVVGGEIFETGDSYNSHYHISISSTGQRFIKGATTFDTKAKIVLVTYNNEEYYGIKFYSGVAANIHLVGWQKIDSSLFVPETYNDSSFTNVKILSDNSATAPQTLNYDVFNPTTYNNTWGFDDASLTSADLTTNYDFGKKLTLTTSEAVTYMPEESTGSGSSADTGYIEIAEGEAFTLKMYDACTVTIGCGSAIASTKVTIAATNGLSTRSVSSSSNTVVAKITFTKTTTTEETLTISNTGGNARYYYITIKYSSTSSKTTEALSYLTSYIDSLKNTGIDGTPHTINVTGTINKSIIIGLASKLRHPEKQIVLNLSGTEMSDVTDWGTDFEGDLSNGADDHGGLFSAFYGCTSLKSFYYPSNVTKSGGNTFYGCTYLTDVHFDNVITDIGALDNWINDNNGIFSGTKVRSVVIPASVEKISNCAFSSSDVENLYFKDGSYFENDDTYFNGESLTWVNTNQTLKLHCCSTLQTKWLEDASTTFDSANGYSTKYLSSSELRSDHIDATAWDNDESTIDYEV